MRISQQGIDLIKQFEGCKLKPYLCPAKKWTVGYGHVLGNGATLAEADNRTFTKEEVDVLLRNDLRRFESGVQRLCPVPLIKRQHVFDCLTSFAYNLGLGTLQRSTLRQKILRKDGEGAAKELLRYDKVGGRPLKGLTRRRQAEYRLFTQIDPIKEE
jgi:lysozyme